MKESGQLSRILRQWLPDSKVSNSILYPIGSSIRSTFATIASWSYQLYFIGRLLGRWRVQIDGFGKHSFCFCSRCHSGHRGFDPAPLGTGERFEETQAWQLQPGQGPLSDQQATSKGHNADTKWLKMWHIFSLVKSCSIRWEGVWMGSSCWPTTQQSSK